MAVIARILVGKQRQSFLNLDLGQYVVGRSSQADLYIQSQSISRQHAQIDIQAFGKASITDLGSKNGTFIDANRIERFEIHRNIPVTFGDVACEFVWVAESKWSDDELSTRPPEAAMAKAVLTPAEQKVLELVLGGFPEKTIAQKLCLSRHTIHSHIKKIYASYEVHSRAELMSVCLASQASKFV